MKPKPLSTNSPNVLYDCRIWILKQLVPEIYSADENAITNSYAMKKSDERRIF